MRFALTLLIALACSQARAQTLTEYFAHASSDLNTGAATTLVFCKPVTLVKGAGSIEVEDGVVTATVAQLSLLPSDGTPHATNPYTQTGFMIRTPVGRTLYKGTKATSTTVALADGAITGTSLETLPAGNPLADGTYTDWGFWSTTCQWAATTIGPRSELVYGSVPHPGTTGRLAATSVTHYRPGAFTFPAMTTRCKPDFVGAMVTAMSLFAGMTIADGTAGTQVQAAAALVNNQVIPSYPSPRCTVALAGSTVAIEGSTIYHALR